VILIFGLLVGCAYLVTGQYKNRFPTLTFFWGTSVRLGRKECVKKEIPQRCDSACGRFNSMGGSDDIVSEEMKAGMAEFEASLE